MTALFLTLHLAGAAVTGVLLCWSVLSLVQNRKARYQRHITSLAACSGFQLVSGAVLGAFSTQNVSGTLFCTRLGLYVAVIMLVEYWLYRKSEEKNRRECSLRGAYSILTAGTIVSVASFLFF